MFPRESQNEHTLRKREMDHINFPLLGIREKVKIQDSAIFIKIRFRIFSCYIELFVVEN